MSAHTPGPWPDPEYDNDDCSGGYWYDIPGVCRAIYKTEDARLIAAAPELLAAVEASLAYNSAKYEDVDALYDRWIDLSRAAIEKATS